MSNPDVAAVEAGQPADQQPWPCRPPPRGGPIRRLRSPLARAVVPVLGGIVVLAADLPGHLGHRGVHLARGRRDDDAPGPSRFEVGNIAAARVVAEDGPIVLPGLHTTSGDRTLVVDHGATTRPRAGACTGATPPIAMPSCPSSRSSARAFTDCDGTHDRRHRPGPPDPTASIPSSRTGRDPHLDLRGVTEPRIPSTTEVGDRRAAAAHARRRGVRRRSRCAGRACAADREPADRRRRRCAEAPVELVEALPGLRANVQNTAARLPRIAGRLAISTTAHGAWPTTNKPCAHVPTRTMSASWIDAWSGCFDLRQPGDRPALLLERSAIISAAFHVFPVRLSTRSAAFIARNSSRPSHERCRLGRMTPTRRSPRREAADQTLLERRPGEREVLRADARRS